ncbi:unnamed protein product [Urochloa humidicola]
MYQYNYKRQVYPALIKSTFQIAFFTFRRSGVEATVEERRQASGRQHMGRRSDAEARCGRMLKVWSGGGGRARLLDVRDGARARSGSGGPPGRPRPRAALSSGYGGASSARAAYHRCGGGRCERARHGSAMAPPPTRNGRPWSVGDGRDPMRL